MDDQLLFQEQVFSDNSTTTTGFGQLGQGS
jgi:hypothetical protein